MEHGQSKAMRLPTLIVIEGPDQGKTYQLTVGTIRIGRSRANQFKLRDTEVSRQHAIIRVTESGLVIEDVGSSNGTYVNGVRITRAPLGIGDTIQVGRTKVVVGTVPSTIAPARSPDVQLVGSDEEIDASAIVRRVPHEDGLRLLEEPLAQGANRTALANLSILYQASQAVSHIGDIPSLLDQILSLVLRSVPAERAAILLVENGEPRPYAARTQQGRQTSKIQISRTIVAYVLTAHEGVLTTDATQDSRFKAGASVQQFAIREAICVPMEGRHGVVGVLYLDRRARLPGGADEATDTLTFTEDHLHLALAIGRIAAVAIEETRYHQALLRAERLAAIGQAMAALSHHIKNILQGFRSGGAVLELGLKRNDMKLVSQGWNAVKRNQDRIFHLVMDMLSYSKDRTPLWEEVEANALAREVLESAAARAEELGVRLQLEPADCPVRCYLDAQAIHQVLLNLVLNALDALEDAENGQVIVRVTPDEESRTIVFTVADNGPGIPPEIQANIFSPFFSTKGSRGTGLGLAVSDKIVREHDGQIVLHSQPGKGAVFEVRLPWYAETPDQPEGGTEGADQMAHPTLLHVVRKDLPAEENHPSAEEQPAKGTGAPSSHR